MLANTPQRRRQIRIAKDLSRHRRLSVRQKDARESRALREREPERLPVLGVRLRHRDTFFRECRGRCARPHAIKSLPKRRRSASHPATAPGTVTESMPASGISFTTPFARRASIVMPFGAHPLAFRPYSFFVFAS